MSHSVSADDREFLRAFESFEVAPSDFNHPAHVRLAYVYLCSHSVDEAADKMKSALLAFLNHLGVGESKYHETMTRAWVKAVNHFMTQSRGCRSSAEFIARHPQLLDSKIMLTHYSAEVLFSTSARKSFVEPDIQSIPPL